MKKNIFAIVSILMVLGLGACNLPSSVPPVSSYTSSPTAALFADTATATIAPVVLLTATASPVPAPQDPLVLRATLCWVGPGPKYEVVSALNQNIRVKLLGRGSISGWFVVDNPTYHDPCWVAEGDLQIDAGTDLINIKTFTPPPLPTPTKPPATPTPSPIPV